jgi:hypothetical protein
MNINGYSPQIITGACAVVLVMLLLIVWGVARQRSMRRTATLRARFGPEYDVALHEYGSRDEAEGALESRLHRVQSLTLRPLDDVERRHYLEEWDAIQSRFIDHPRGAVTEADELINSVLARRGYTGGRFNQRVADISVHHAQLVDPYRRANGVVVRAGKNEATTEELRSAMILYRALFEELIQIKTMPMPAAQAA